MTPAARLSAAIDVIAAIDDQRIPAAKALKEWGTAHRFAGSGDRAAISGLIYDVLRRQASSAWIMDADTPRARVLGMLKTERGLGADAVAALCDGSRFAPDALTDGERHALASRSVADAPAHIAGDYPEWLDGHLAEVFGDERVAEATAMASRAPLDMRVNTLKAKREKVEGSLAHLGAAATRWSPIGLRIVLGADARNPGIHSEEDFIKGAVEVQDEGSQLAALFSGAKPGEQVIDLCAGAGGKTLAIGASMRNTGRLYAFDVSGHRLDALKPRLARSGLSNVHPAAIAHERDDRVKRLAGKIDRVLVDAPCSGLGTLRRNPDLKWRQSPKAVEELVAKQTAILASAARLLKPGGRLVYATCSILPQENEAIAEAFSAAHPDFEVLDAGTVLQQLKVEGAHGLCSGGESGARYLRLWPHLHQTDGFFAAIWSKRA